MVGGGAGELIEMITYKARLHDDYAARLKEASDFYIVPLHLPRAFAEQLDSSVREKFLELWKAAQTSLAEEEV
jgi:hypothetical protein